MPSNRYLGAKPEPHRMTSLPKTLHQTQTRMRGRGVDEESKQLLLSKRIERKSIRLTRMVRIRMMTPSLRGVGGIGIAGEARPLRETKLTLGQM